MVVSGLRCYKIPDLLVGFVVLICIHFNKWYFLQLFPFLRIILRLDFNFSKPYEPIKFTLNKLSPYLLFCKVF